MCIRDSVHVGLESLHAPFTAKAALLETAEGRCGIESVVRVEPDHARLELARDLKDLGALVGPHARGKPVRSVVGAGNGLLRCAEGHDCEDRAKDLLAGDAVAGLHTGEEARTTPEALGGQRMAIDLVEPRPFRAAGVEVPGDGLELTATV